jgi:hypothetical protein
MPKQLTAGSPPTATDRSAMPHSPPWRPASTAPSACPPRPPCSPWRASRRMSPTDTPTRSSGATARPGSPPGSSRPRSTAWSTLASPRWPRAGPSHAPHRPYGPRALPASTRTTISGAQPKDHWATAAGPGTCRNRPAILPHLQPMSAQNAAPSWPGPGRSPCRIGALASESAMRVAARRSSCYGRCCWRQESRLDGLPAVIGCPAAQWVNG